MPVFGLIGGKRNIEGKVKNGIERHLVELTKKASPTILFCPYAAFKDIDKSIAKFHSLMEGISCNIIDMTWNNIDDFEALYNDCDILYVGGGHCDELVGIFKEHHLDEVLLRHITDDKIWAGSSAGAMLYTKCSMGDRYMYTDNFHNYNYKMVDCLGMLNMTICPHYQNEDLIMYNDEVKKHDCISFGIEEDTMVVISDNKFYVVKEEKKLGIYCFRPSEKYRMVPLYEGVVYEEDCSFRS